MKKFIYLFCALALVLTSCSKDTATETPSNSNVLLKRAVTGDNTFEYIYEGSKLMRINTSFSGYNIYTYTGDLITRISRYYNDGAFLGETIYEYDTNQRLISEKYLNQEDSTASKYSYTYNLDGTINYDEYSGDLTTQNNLIRTGKIWMNSNNETIKIEEYQSGTLVNRSEFTHDTKNSLFKNVVGFNKLFITGSQGKSNNILTYNRYDSSNILIYSYSDVFEYNSNNYPISATRTFNDGSISTTNWFYE